jgi:uncharacterized protein
MKKIIILILGIVIASNCCFAKNTMQIDTVSENDKVKFAELLKKATEGDGEAQFWVGKIYLDGLIVKRDVNVAFDWTKKAAITGFVPAWTELGYYLKFGVAKTLNYTKAYDFFSRGAEFGHPSAIYLKGYMTYKGFGCEQDYKASMIDFRKAASRRNASAMYMMGLCFRNGFGVTANADSARYWLKKSLDARNIHAFDEMQTFQPEYKAVQNEQTKNLDIVKGIGVKAGFEVNQYSDVQSNVKATELNGIYNGYFLKYDWSHTRVTGVTPMSLLLSCKDTIVTGTWMEQGIEKPIDFKAVWRDNKLVFKDFYYKRQDHYHEMYPLVYNLQNATVQMAQKNGTTYLKSNVAVFVPSMVEPYYPVSLVLSKSANDNSKVAQNTNDKTEKNAEKTINTSEIAEVGTLIAYPNPFDNEINVVFSLVTDGDAVLKVTAIDGQVLYHKNLKDLKTGSHSIVIPLAVASGEYIVSLEVAHNIKTFNIVKP